MTRITAHTISSCHHTATTDTLPLSSPSSWPIPHLSCPTNAVHPVNPSYASECIFPIDRSYRPKGKNTLKTSNGKDGRRAESRLPPSSLSNIDSPVGEGVGMIVLGPLAEVHQGAVVDHKPPAPTHLPQTQPRSHHITSHHIDHTTSPSPSTKSL